MKWARVSEAVLALWLLISPWILIDPPAETNWLLFISTVAGLLVLIISYTSQRLPERKGHLAVIPIALVLIAIAFLIPESPPPAPYVNFVITGLLLMIFAIVPTRALRHAEAWDRYIERADAIRRKDR